jgi:tetratricopeptide (TPR) repeat protein
MSDLALAEGAATTAIATADAEGDTGAMAEGMARLAFISEAHGDFDHSQELLDQALPLAETVGGVPLIQVLIGLAWSHLHSGALDAALATARRSVSVAEQTADHELLQPAIEAVGAVLSYHGDFEEARRHHLAAAAAARANGNLYGEADALANVAFTWIVEGDHRGTMEAYRQAERDQTRSLELMRQLGMREHASLATTNLAMIRCRLGDSAGARDLARDALQLATQLDAQLAAIQALVTHSEAVALEGSVSLGMSHLGAVRSHPTVGELRIEIERILAHFRAEGHPEIDAWLETGSSLELDDVIASVLADDTAPRAF